MTSCLRCQRTDVDIIPGCMESIIHWSNFLECPSFQWFVHTFAGLLILVSQEVMGQIISGLLGAASIKRVVKSMSETWHTHIVMEGVWGFTPECPKDLLCSVPILSVKTLRGNLQRILPTSACPALLVLWPEAPYLNRSTHRFSSHKHNCWFWGSNAWCYIVRNISIFMGLF